MRLKINESKTNQTFYVIESTYVDGKHSSRVVERLGTYEELAKEHEDPVAWAHQYIDQLTKKDKEEQREVIVKYKQSKRIPKGKELKFNGGYLFLQQIYYALGLETICKDMLARGKATYDLNAILSRLVFGRILFPASKRSTHTRSKTLLEEKNFTLHQIYRALDCLADNDTLLQSALYKNSQKLSKRNDAVLYYDCTNFFFETEQESGLRQYGPSKEHRPAPLVEMGLFMDGDGIPLAFSIHPGNENEQKTLVPLEQQIIKDFGHAKFVVCTDSGLSSWKNREFNTANERRFITAQSIRKLKKHLKEWCLEPDGWRLEGCEKLINIKTIEASDVLYKRYKNATFYKDRWINENGIEQHLIVSFSLKYKAYQKEIRNRQIERAINSLEKGTAAMKPYGQNDVKRFIAHTSFTEDGEVAQKDSYTLKTDRILEEERYDGFYAVCTNLEDNPGEIIKVNHRR